MTQDIRWLIRVQHDQGERLVVAHHLRASDYHELTRGSTQTYDLVFDDSTQTSDVTGGSGATAGGEYGATAGGEYGALAGGGAAVVSDYRTGYETVRSLLEYPSASTGTNPVAWYREYVPSRADVTSHVVQIQPLDSLGAITGVWGVVTGGSDETQYIGSHARISLEVFVLAEAPSFGSYSDVKSEFSPPVTQ